MNKEELRTLLNKIAAAYPNFVKRGSSTDDIMKAWTEAMGGIELSAASAALERHIKNSRFIPTPADILQLIDVHDKWGSAKEAVEHNKRVYFKITGKEWQSDA